MTTVHGEGYRRACRVGFTTIGSELAGDLLLTLAVMKVGDGQVRNTPFDVVTGVTVNGERNSVWYVCRQYH